MPVGHVWPLWALKKKKRCALSPWDCGGIWASQPHRLFPRPIANLMFWLMCGTVRKHLVISDSASRLKTTPFFFSPPFFTCQGHWAFIAKSNRCLWLPSPWIRSLIIEWWIPHFCVLWGFFFFFLPVHERAPACVLCVCLFAHFHHHISDELADLSLFPATSSTRLEDLSFLDNPRAGGHRGSVRKHNTAERTNEDAKGT